MKSFVVIVCVVFCGLADCGLAPFVTPCKEADLVCLKSSAEKALPVLAAGVPELGIAKMDPMFMEQVKTSQAGLDMDFRNTNVTGLRHCKVLNLKRAGPKTYLDLKCSVNMVGDYTLGGKLLIMPIEGKGKYGIKIRDIVVKIAFQVGEKEVDGEKYWTVKSWKHTSEVEKGVHFQFNHLFNGNKQLSDAVHEFANSNWRDIFQEVAPPIVKAIVAQILEEITKLFDKVPINQLVVS
ncbi:protein takeout-like [Anticarsia gemmatalis]|uniref:protein takeout-like n=1 Tax=Anticarsia gemmatalis TaxID=129554 RepID=UPI003F7662F1